MLRVCHACFTMMSEAELKGCRWVYNECERPGRGATGLSHWSVTFISMYDGSATHEIEEEWTKSSIFISYYIIFISKYLYSLDEGL